MNKFLALSGYFSVLFLVGGCATVRSYVAPSADQPRSEIKFDYQSIYPISTGVVHLVEGDVKCKDSVADKQKIFVRGRGNPLISDLNADGTFIPADNEIRVRAVAITSVYAMCSVAASFTPLVGRAYNLKLNQKYADFCTFEIVDANSGASVKDFKIIDCKKSE